MDALVDAWRWTVGLLGSGPLPSHHIVERYGKRAVNYFAIVTTGMAQLWF